MLDVILYKMRVQKKEIIIKYSAKNSKFVIGEKHQFSLNWRLFGHRITKNQFFKKFKIISQNNICPICEEKFYDKICLHHIDYDHTCQRGENIKTSNYNNPNCEECFNDNKEYFISCSEKTVIVHNKCHTKLHNDNLLKENRYIRIRKSEISIEIEDINSENKSLSLIGHNSKEIKKKVLNLEEIRKTYRNAYMPWTKSDDEKLIMLFHENNSFEKIAEIFERNLGSIQSRLKKLKLIE